MNGLSDRERDDWLKVLTDRYGFTAEDFRDYRIFRLNRRRVGIMAGDHQARAGGRLESAGMEFLGVKSSYPKLTTAAARVFGHLARRHVVGLDAVQMLAYLRGQTQMVAVAACRNLQSPGHVLVHQQGVYAGVGLLRFAPGDAMVELISQYPARWAACLEAGHGD